MEGAGETGSQGGRKGGRCEFTSPRYGEWVSEKMQKRRQ